jgi:hypothetical protein
MPLSRPLSVCEVRRGGCPNALETVLGLGTRVPSGQFLK